METLNFAIPTLFGLEALAADELRRLGLDQVRAENGRVLCSGRPGDIPRMDLNLRTGERVLLVLGTFPAGDFDALFEGTRALPWEQFIPREGRFPVKGHCLNSALHSVPTGAGTRCATPSAVRAPSPSRPPSSPKTGLRA